MKIRNFSAMSGLLLALSAGAPQAAIDQSAAFAQCHAAVQSADPGLAGLEFQRSNSVTYAGGRYKLRFNFNADADGDRQYQKARCIVSNTGKLELLETSPGSWRF